MLISTVKEYDIYTVNEKRLAKPGFGDRLKDITDVERLEDEITGILAGNGRVYGIYKKKELVGVYLFEKVEDYFVKDEYPVIKLGKKEFDFEKFWYGSNTEAYVFRRSVCLDEMRDIEERIKKDIKIDLSDRIQLGIVAGVAWEDQLMYRKNVEEKANGILGVIGGFAIGCAIGMMIFQDWIGIGLGFLYAAILGGAKIVFAKRSEVDTLDFIRKSEDCEDAVK